MIGEIFDDNYNLINLFFLFSFLGWLMETIVIKVQTGVLENRGFAKGPFCIIYGVGAFGAMIFFTPIANNTLALYIVGAITATTFEYLVARLMIRLFGDFWWDYSYKRFNYKGILCLESTLGWGLVAVIIVGFLFDYLLSLVSKMPMDIGKVCALMLIIGYGTDFFFSYKKSRKNHKEELENEENISDNNDRIRLLHLFK
ncbi:Putative ABC-transporter type IV [Acetitomaculum ruminis DSM 5522]|uniref:Putative ABC-transporter type IV n=1 Tax=Acetitomaculum ruminis DSM 5522 TaxID=1120918 RepID=A0A1I0UX96_9FIRM|nr:putative ABC transporter permease [Acetitomaculum ruminis]SFA68719.1 Putative ABC-transporter type IV [Acetitomaculum ruminis DSM 5522]